MLLTSLILGENASLVEKIDISNIRISGVTADSRMVEPGFLFAALPGATHDGRNFVSAAIERGAAAIIGPIGTHAPKNIPVLTSSDARATFAHLTAKFFQLQPKIIAAVTGTNGKTSVVTFTQPIWSSIGLNSVSIGTLGLQLPDGSTKPTLTTPDTVTLHKELANAVENDISHVVLEASSHGLEQRRIDGVNLMAAGFTNLSHDHLDYHHTKDKYISAKMRLFKDLLTSEGVAVINADTPEAGVIRKDFCGRKITYGFKGEQLVLRSIKTISAGIRVSLEVYGTPLIINFPLLGRFQAYNILCAAGLAIGCGASADSVISALKKLKEVKGRIQLAGKLNGGSVYIDYAHTPSALENALLSLRPHTVGRLITVFGCGGNRDRTKRRMMGAISEKFSDITIVTDDNPRSEDPAKIRSEILEGALNGIEIGHRIDAIAKGLKMLKAGDLLLIAGKGHEKEQIIGEKVLSFDDLAVTKTLIETLNHT